MCLGQHSALILGKSAEARWRLEHSSIKSLSFGFSKSHSPMSWCYATADWSRSEQFLHSAVDLRTSRLLRGMHSNLLALLLRSQVHQPGDPVWLLNNPVRFLPHEKRELSRSLFCHARVWSCSSNESELGFTQFNLHLQLQESRPFCYFTWSWRDNHFETGNLNSPLTRMWNLLVKRQRSVLLCDDWDFQNRELKWRITMTH